MDNDRGKFIQADNMKEMAEKLKEVDGSLLDRMKVNLGIFHVGEELEIKGSKFRVHSIKPKRLILKLLPR